MLIVDIFLYWKEDTIAINTTRRAMDRMKDCIVETTLGLGLLIYEKLLKLTL